MAGKLLFQNIEKTYGDGDSSVQVLNGINLEVNEGEFTAIVGPSGSGKSTLLSLAGALLTPTSGKIVIGGQDISKLTKNELNDIRLSRIGFIFQSAHLIPYLTVIDQLLLISELSGKRDQTAKARANELLERLGLSKRANQYPDRLSGGERQRVAIARAWMNDPDVILADEPTASLDSERGHAIVQMIAENVKRDKKAALMVTHDLRMLDYCDRVLTMENGRLVEQSRI